MNPAVNGCFSAGGGKVDGFLPRVPRPAALPLPQPSFPLPRPPSRRFPASVGLSSPRPCPAALPCLNRVSSPRVPRPAAPLPRSGFPPSRPCPAASLPRSDFPPLASLSLPLPCLGRVFLPAPLPRSGLLTLPPVLLLLVQFSLPCAPSSRCSPRPWSGSPPRAPVLPLPCLGRAFLPAPLSYHASAPAGLACHAPLSCRSSFRFPSPVLPLLCPIGLPPPLSCLDGRPTSRKESAGHRPAAPADADGALGVLCAAKYERRGRVRSQPRRRDVWGMGWQGGKPASRFLCVRASVVRAQRLCGHGGANGWIIPTFQPQRAPVRIQGQMDESSSPPFQLQKSACSDTGVQMDGSSPPFSRKKRLFGHGGKWMDHSPFSRKRAPVRIRGRKWMDHPHPPFSRKERLFGYRGKWMDHPPFQPQRAPARTRGCKWMDHPHLSAAKERLFGHGGKWIDHSPFTRKRAPMRTRGAGG